MFKAYKYRLYPTNSQKELIAKHIGSSRFVYNLALETKNTAYLGSKHSLSQFDLIKQLPDLKKECEWLKEVNSQSLQQSIQNMDTAFKGFFKGGGFPRFKSKHRGRQSFPIPQNVELDLEKSELVIPKFKKKGIKVVIHREIKGDIKSATISVTPTGKYFASLLVDTQRENPAKSPINENETIGIDLGIKHFAITSDGEVFDNPKYLKEAISRLKYTQSKYSKSKGKRTKKRLALLHERVTNKRKDFLHKTSIRLIRENQTIALEDLNVKGMMARCKPKMDENGKYLSNGQTAKSGLNRSIQDVGWSTFVSMLEYKAEWHGKNTLRIGRFAPSSKTCSSCGRINKGLTLNDREWTCVGCSAVLDRDINAAVNIKSFALKKQFCGEHTVKNQDELPTLVGVLTPEARPIASGVGG